LLCDKGVPSWIAGDVAEAGIHGAGGSVTLHNTHA
jgi:phosphoribosylformylglycinamidine cyclo-ligase